MRRTCMRAVLVFAAWAMLTGGSWGQAYREPVKTELT